MNLKYGRPPKLEECEPKGEIIVPLKLTMPSTPELQQREKSTIHLVGTDLPDWVRARTAVRKLETYGGNVSAKVPGLGTIAVGSEGWEVHA